ncbi:MAG TPA: ATPase, T2SS/T4P/T4SS family [Thermodesulfovibrionales bacterium]|nr:ATPase, T2SS/T4P/T4SS family [Thermodesulfovibrionales bacterium]
MDIQSDGYRIGELLVQEGLLSEKQLQEAVAKQYKKTSYSPLGEVCVQMRFISKAQLNDILKKYRKRLNLGTLLVQMGLISQEEIEDALELQKTEGKKLGRILIEQGYITESNLVNTLSIQLGIPKMIPAPGLIDPVVLKGVSKAFLQKNECLPAFRDGDSITIIMSDPLSEETIRSMEHVFKCRVEPAIAGSEDILKGIKVVFDDLRMMDSSTYRPTSSQKNVMICDAQKSDGSQDSIEDVLNFIISSAIMENASDIHIEPLENMLRVRYRIDGMLQHKTDLPSFIAPNLVSRLKALCGLDIANRRKHQDGRIAARIMNKGFDLRISTYSSINGESLSIRILPNQNKLMDIEMLGYSPYVLSLYKRVLSIPAGIILITGPSNSGKTTTLYASLKYLNNMDKKIVTVEDPIEYTINGVIQGQISEKSGLVYKNFIKSSLRQDPDVIMIGEIRDLSSAEAVVETALSGHKVLTSFHTDDTSSALLRLHKIGIETFLISSTVISVLSQRLVRTLCPNCKEPYVPGEEVLASFDSISPINLDEHEFYTSRGCLDCNNLGYKGRTAICEIMIVNNEIRDAILNRQPTAQIRAVARQSGGLLSMREDGFYKATKGLTSLEEIIRMASYNDGDSLLRRSSEEIVALSEMEH